MQEVRALLGGQVAHEEHVATSGNVSRIHGERRVNSVADHMHLVGEAVLCEGVAGGLAGDDDGVRHLVLGKQSRSPGRPLQGGRRLGTEQLEVRQHVEAAALQDLERGNV